MTYITVYFRTGSYRGQRAAIKVVKFFDLARDEALFIKEVEILYGLHHPNIAIFTGAGITDSRSKDKIRRNGVLVMQLLQYSLHDAIHTPADMPNMVPLVADDQKLAVVRQIVSGMLFLHSTNPKVL